MTIIRHGYATTRRTGSTRAYRMARAQTLAEERTCHLCGHGATVGDPLEADHVVPHSQGGSDERANLRAAHRSCNLRRGATIVRWGGGRAS